MSEKERITRDIHEFKRGNMDWEDALDLIKRVAKSEEWIDYLLMEMETLECSVTPPKTLPHFCEPAGP